MHISFCAAIHYSLVERNEFLHEICTCMFGALSATSIPSTSLIFDRMQTSLKISKTWQLTAKQSKWISSSIAKNEECSMYFWFFGWSVPLGTCLMINHLPITTMHQYQRRVCHGCQDMDDPIAFMQFI